MIRVVYNIMLSEKKIEKSNIIRRQAVVLG